MVILNGRITVNLSLVAENDNIIISLVEMLDWEKIP